MKISFHLALQDFLNIFFNAPQEIRSNFTFTEKVGSRLHVISETVFVSGIITFWSSGVVVVVASEKIVRDIAETIFCELSAEDISRPLLPPLP